MSGTDVDLAAVYGHGPASSITTVDGGTLALVLRGSGGVTRTFTGLPPNTTLFLQVQKIIGSTTTSTKVWVSFA